MAHEAQTRLPWTAEEDAILISLVERYGEKRWNMVANGLPGRTGKGCSHRWRTYLRPDVKHPHLEPFTEWEAAVIVQAQRDMGNNWLAIAKLLLPGRSNTAVKNFWHCRLKSGSGTNVNRFIVNQYPLHYLLNQVPHEERTHPVALPAFPSTAPTGQLHHHKNHHEPAMMHLPIPAMDANSTMVNQAAASEAYNLEPAVAAAPADMMAAAGGSNMLGVAADTAATAHGPNPTGPKEDLRRRASAYVKQQLALMGQAVARNTSGAGSGQPELLGCISMMHGNNTGCTLAPDGSVGWSGATGRYSMHGGISSPHTAKKAGGAGRGRARRPKPRDSCDDPYDETYVPAGMSREEEITRCSNFAPNSSHVLASDALAATGMDDNCIGAQSTLIPASISTQHPDMAAIDAAAAAAMPCLANISTFDAAAAAAHYRSAVFTQHHYSVATTHKTIVGGSSSTTVAPAAETDKMPWATASTASPGGYGAGAAATAATANSTRDSDVGADKCVNRLTTAVAAAAAAGTGNKALELDDAAAMAFASFRQSGAHFNMSISSLDDFMSGGTATGSGEDNGALGSVAGLLRGTSLDISRFSLTGSADGLGVNGRRSSWGCGLSSVQRVSQQQFVHIHHQQELQQLEHMLMPPPKCPYVHSTTVADTAAVAAAAGSSLSSHMQGGGSSSTAHAAKGCSYHGRCDSPFKKAAAQQAPFSPAVAAVASVGGPCEAPSSQPTVCSAVQAVLYAEQHSQQQQQQQRQQQFANHGAPHCQQQQRLPATFESVLQAILPKGNASSTPEKTASQQQQQQHGQEQQAPAMTMRVNDQPEPGTGPFTQQGSNGAAAEPHTCDSEGAGATGLALAGRQATGNPLRVQCPDEIKQQRHHRASKHLLSPVGKYLAHPSDDSYGLFAEVVPVCSYDLHIAPDDCAQTRAERRSIRMLLGALASTDPLAWNPADGCSVGAAAIDPAAHADSSHVCGSSSRMPCSSLSSGGCGLGIRGRVSSRGAPSWCDLGGATAASAAGARSDQPCNDRGMACTWQTQIGLLPNELGRRQRVSLTAQPPAKKARGSYTGAGRTVARISVGAAEMDDCLSYWQN